MASYRAGVEFIAYNDEPNEDDPDVISGYISVHTLAVAFDKTNESVALDVARMRTTGELMADDRVATAENSAWNDGYSHALHGGLRGHCPYRTGKVFGAALHRAWNNGYDAGRVMLDKNGQLPI